MPFRFIDKLGRDDSFVKTFFEFITNMTVVTVVFAAASWKYEHISNGYVGVLDHVSIVLLNTLGMFMLLILMKNISYLS